MKDYPTKRHRKFYAYILSTPHCLQGRQGHVRSPVSDRNNKELHPKKVKRRIRKYPLCPSNRICLTIIYDQILQFRIIVGSVIMLIFFIDQVIQ